MKEMFEQFNIIGDSTARKYLTVPDVVARVEETYKWYADGKIIMPSKITLDMAPEGVQSWINSMPSYVKPCNTAGIKWVGGFSGNKKLGLPYIKAKIMLTDPDTGLMRALLDGDWISELRTGAQTAVAAKYLIGKKPEVVTIIGSGLQGLSTLICLCEVFDFKEIRVSDIFPEASKNFIAKMAKHSTVPVQAFTENQKACQGADIIVTATTADAPLVKNEWVKEGALVSTIGSFQELDEELIFNADKIIVDHLGQHLHRGEFLKLFQSGKMHESDIYGELHDIIVGKLKGRENDKERIIMSVVGMGCLDISIAAMLYENLVKNHPDELANFDMAV
jgi:alanine dehydrogenase